MCDRRVFPAIRGASPDGVMAQLRPCELKRGAMARVRFPLWAIFCTEGNRDDLRQPVELRGAVEACEQEGVASCISAGQ